MLLRLLRQRVGSPISYQSLSRDIGVSPNTIKKFIHILDALFVTFRITPFSKNIARSVLKEPKVYFYDTGLVDTDIGGKYENLMAISLLKHTLYEQDCAGKDLVLHYIRTKEKEEIDFCLVEDNVIQQFIEAKTSDSSISKTLTKFHRLHEKPAIQVNLELKRERQLNSLQLRKATAFLGNLSL